MKISTVLKEIRRQHHLTQEDLAEKLQVSRSAISRWETEKGIPDIANLIAISREFDLSLDQLIKGDGRLEKKGIADNRAQNWHYLVIFYLLSILTIIADFYFSKRIFMLGLLISTLMLFMNCACLLRKKFGYKRQNKKPGWARFLFKSTIHFMVVDETCRL